MSSSLSEFDRELLGETPYGDGAEGTTVQAYSESGHGAHEDFQGTGFTALNAAADALVKMSYGDEAESSKAGSVGTTTTVPKTPKKRGAAASANDGSTQPTKKRSPTKKATVSATNVDAKTDGEAVDDVTPSPKKRASPTKKTTAAASAAKENGGTNGGTEGLEPVTPSKAKRAPAKGKANKTDNNANTNETTKKSASPTKGSGETVGMTAKDTPRQRQAPKKELAAPRGIPTSWDNADEADRMLVTMKEKGEGWTEIRAAWKEVTGQDTASSTLPNRYNRLKVNMMRMEEGDHQRLLAAKKEIEDAYTTGFWSNVAANMERRGAAKYPSAFLLKTFKDLEAAGKTTIAAANDTDDEDTIEEEEEEQGAGDGAAIKEEEEQGAEDDDAA